MEMKVGIRDKQHFMDVHQHVKAGKPTNYLIGMKA